MKNPLSSGITSSVRRWLPLWLCIALLKPAWAEENAKPVVVLASLQPPFMDLVADKPTGLAVDITRQMFDEAGVPFQFKFMPPKRAYLTALESPNHCVLAAERSQEREALFHWVSPVLMTRHALYGLSDEAPLLRTLRDARPYLIGSYLGSGVGEYLEGMGYKVEYTGRNDLNAQKLAKRRIDLWASDTVSADLIIREANLNIGKPLLVFLTTLQSMACNLEMPRERIKRLQTALTRMYRDGSIQRHYAAYRDGATGWLQ